MAVKSKPLFHPEVSFVAQALKLKIKLSALVSQAYGLTQDEIELMWKAAPPRIPVLRL